MTPPVADIQAGCDYLRKRDTQLATAYNGIGIPVWRSVPANYASLARIVVYQLISTNAAEAIWVRVSARHPDMQPANILSDDEAGLRACGLSRPKVAHMRSIAEAVETRAIDFDQLADMEINAARRQLLAVKGIGPWTADTFLMNALGHMDAFPAGDVGLMEAYRQLSDAENRYDIRAFSILAESWRPYRGVAAHLLYGWLNLQRTRQGGAVS